MDVTITNQQLTSALSLHVFVSTDKIANPIENLRLIQEYGVLNVFATDRYCAAWGQYPLDDEHNDTSATSNALWITPKDAKAFFPIIKKLNPNGFAHVTNTGVALENGMVLPVAEETRTYPELPKLWDNFERTENRALAAMQINIAYLSKLTKIVHPTMAKQNTLDDWRLDFSQTDTGKVGPVKCTPRIRGIEVLIQPMMMPKEVG